MVADSQPSIDPDGIASHTFNRVRRGFEADEVRAYLVQVAGQMRELLRRHDDLGRRVVELERQTADPRELDEETVTELLGEQTARLLVDARRTAQEMREQGEQEAASIRLTASETADRIRNEADQYAENVRGLADEADEKIRADAQAFADGLREAAERETTEQRTAADDYEQRTRENVTAELDALRAKVDNETGEMRRQAESVLAERTAEAEEAATRIRADADAYAASVRADADAVVSTTRADADAYAADTRSAADSYRDTTAAQADADRERIVEEAKDEGRAMVQEARDYRERVIADLADRRRAARHEMEKMASTRDALAVALTDARFQIERAHSLLQQAEIDPVEVGDLSVDRRRLVAVETEADVDDLLAGGASDEDEDPDVGEHADGDGGGDVDGGRAEDEEPGEAEDFGEDADEYVEVLVVDDGNEGPDEHEEPENADGRDGGDGDRPDEGDAAGEGEDSAEAEGLGEDEDDLRREGGLSDPTDPSGDEVDGPAVDDELGREQHDPGLAEVDGGGSDDGLGAREPEDGSDDSRDEAAAVDDAGADPETHDPDLLSVIPPVGEDDAGVLATDENEGESGQPSGDRLGGGEAPSEPTDAEPGAGVGPGIDEIGREVPDEAQDAESDVDATGQPEDPIESDDVEVATEIESAEAEAEADTDIDAAEADTDTDAEDGSESEEDDGAEPGMEHGGVAPGIDDLFARIRAEQEASEDEPDDGSASDAESEGGSETETDGAGSETGAVPERSDPDPTAVGSDPAADTPDRGSGERSVEVDDDERDLLELRDVTTDAVERQLARRLKRELADEQNELLDLLRRSGADPVRGEVLPGPEEHLARYRDAVLEDLQAAERAGAGFYGDPPEEEADIGDIAGDFARDLVRQFRSRMERAFDEGGGEDDIAEAVRTLYREWKTQRIADVARHFVVTAFSRGVLGAAPEGVAFRWVVDHGGDPAPDCEDNALAGGVVRGEAFPTGEHYPPAHAGCRCLLVPIESPTGP